MRHVKVQNGTKAKSTYYERDFRCIKLEFKRLKLFFGII